jgi:DNA helicase-2/ATP-dependent DNA helicase PcrA
MIENESFYGEELFDLHGLNTAQKKAASKIDGYIRLTAGAGSGKTKTLATRFIYLTEYLGMPRDSVLCITFTRKAADEMRKRIRDMSGSQAEGSRISTYQGFCHSVLKEDIYRLHFNSEYGIIGEDDQEDMIRKIYADLKLQLKDGELSQVKKQIASYKSRNFLSLIKDYVPEITLNSSGYSYEENVIRFSSEGIVVAHYLTRQIQDSTLDFMDLLNFVHYLFHHHTDVLEKWQDRLQYIMVDEFQDSNRKELALIDLLSRKNKNLFVVGDPDQAIYSFKGGDIKVFLGFNTYFPNVIDLFLNENYRSSHRIVNLSNEMIEKNKNRIDKASHPVKKDSEGNPFIGQQVTHFHGKYEKDEFEYITQEIESLLKKGFEYKDISLLVRSHKSKKPLETSFVKAGIPYTIADGLKFYARSEIKIALAYVRMAHHNDNDAFLLSIKTPKRGIGDETIKKIIAHSHLNLCSYYEALQSLANTNSSILANTKAVEYIKIIEIIRQNKLNWRLSDLVHNVIRVSGYYNYICEGSNEVRITNIMDLVESVKLLEERKQQPVPLSEYITLIDELSRKAEDNEEKNEVKIMTIHSSKGLEFKVVFLPCFNDKIIPSAQSLANRYLFEEERRMAYVAFTRAEELLYITETEARDSRGINKLPSRFLFDFDRTQINQINMIPESLISQFKREYQSEDPNKPKITILPNGSQFQHPIFGLCTIINFENDRYDVSCEDKNGQKLNRKITKNFPCSIINPPTVNNLQIVDVDEDDDYEEDTHEINESEALARPNEYESLCLGQTPDVMTPQGMQVLAQTLIEVDQKPSATQPLDMSKPPMTVQTTHHVEHHSWGIGFIESENEDGFLIHFPEVDVRRTIPKNSTSIKKTSLTGK